MSGSGKVGYWGRVEYVGEVLTFADSQINLVVVSGQEVSLEVILYYQEITPSKDRVEHCS